MRPWSERDWVRWASRPGAAWALLLSVRKPDLLKAVIAFYGTGLWLQSEYSVARAAYPGHYAEVDEWEPVEEVRGTQEALRAAGHEVTFTPTPASDTGSSRRTSGLRRGSCSPRLRAHRGLPANPHRPSLAYALLSS